MEPQRLLMKIDCKSNFAFRSVDFVHYQKKVNWE